MARAIAQIPPAVRKRGLSLADVLFFCTMGVAVVVYFSGVQQNLPLIIEIDEHSRVVRAVHMLATKTLNPHWFGHPASTVIYPLVGIYYLWGVLFLRLPALPPYPTLIPTFETDPSQFYVVARLVTMGYGLLSLPLAYLIGRRVFGARVALIGVWCALVYTVIVAHAQVARSDSAGLFYGLLSLYLALRLYDRPSVADRLLAGAAVGLAISSRYFDGIFLLPLLAVEAATLWRLRAAGQLDGAALRRACIGPAAAAVAFACTSPYFFLAFDEAIDDIRREARDVHLGSDGLSQFGNFLWYWSAGLPRSVGWPQYALAALGTGLVVRRRQGLGLLLLAAVVAFIAGVSLPRLHHQRWILEILPLVALFAAAALVWLADTLGKRLHLARQGTVVLQAVLLLALLGLPAYDLALFSVRQTSPNTNVQAMAWVRQNVPPGARLAYDQYTLHFEGTNALTKSQAYDLGPPGFKQPAFSLGERYTLAQYRGLGFEYLIAGEEIYRRVFAEAARYPEQVAFYEELFALTPVAEFKPAPVRAGAEADANLAAGRPGAGGGSTIRIYKLSP